jgi:sporulation protein YlmC with PRC-barrel domain
LTVAQRNCVLCFLRFLLALRQKNDDAIRAAKRMEPARTIRIESLSNVASTFHQPGDPSMPTATGHTSAIRAKKVIGTNVKDPSGQKLGEVEDIVLDKQSNQIMFAIVGFGGVLGIGEKFHPVPWSTLNYDTSEDSYVVNLTKEQLKAAPADSIEELTKNDGLGYRDRTYAYYKAKPYWQ